MTQITISPALIRKYIGGACSTDEMNAVHQWYSGLKDQSGPVIELELKKQLELKMRMLGHIRSDIQSSSSVRRNKRMKVLLYSWLISAAATLIVVLWLILK
jgi:transmembrane sensor